MVPDGWKETSIKNVCSAIIDCVNKTAPTVDQVTPYRMVRTTNVRDGKLSLKSVKYVSEETYKKWIRRGAPLKNDIILTREAPVGEVALVEEDEGIFLGQRLVMYRTDREKADYKYVLHSLLSNYCQKQLEILCNGGTVHHVRVPECETIKILLPPLPEQKKIARILSTWDKAIETVDKLIENSKQQKKALMQQLLTGKKRLPGFSGEWKEVRLGDVVSVDKKSLDRTTPDHFTFRYISLSDVTSEGINSELNVYKFSSAPSRARRVVSENDILMATVRPNLQAFSRVGEKHNDCIASTGFAVLTPKKNSSSSYIYHYLFHSHMTNQIQSLVAGSNYPAINSSDVKALHIICPPKEEQEAIGHILDSNSYSLNKLYALKAAHKVQKQALMQQLLTGKRRVTVEE